MEILKFKDINLVKSLLKDNNLPVSDLNKEIIFFVEKSADKIIAAGGLESAGKDAIIRSIAVSDDHKGKGLGGRITRQLLQYAREKSKKDIYLLTTTAEEYFPKYGFEKIDRRFVPADVKNSSQYKDVCPDTAVVMKLEFTRNK
jgi:amino-acid N-acetyltransferase